MSQASSKPTPSTSTSPLLTYAAPDPAAEPPQPPTLKAQSKERLHVGGLHPTVDECVLYILTGEALLAFFNPVH
jgi:hypothetical protein